MLWRPKERMRLSGRAGGGGISTALWRNLQVNKKSMYRCKVVRLSHSLSRREHVECGW